MKKVFWFNITLAILLLQGSCSGRKEINVLLISIDTLRADHLSAYGYRRKTSPTIDQVASEGIIFSQAMAQRGQTWTSVTSIMTSMYPHTHGVRENGMNLKDSIPTLAALLKSYGYSTVAFITNMVTSRHVGFDHVYRFRGMERDKPTTKAAIEWLGKNHKKKFFAWIHYIAPHKPYGPPAPFTRRFVSLNDDEIQRLNDRLDKITLNKESISEKEKDQIVSLYDAEIAYVDNQISRVLKTLDDLDLKKNTLLVITADHGEELYDRNQYFYHACSIYDSVLRIPLIIRFPDQVQGHRNVQTVVESIDIAPTIFDLLKLPRPKSFEGKSLKPLILSDDSSSIPSLAYSEIKDKVFSVRTNHWRYIYNPESYRPDGEPYREVPESQRSYIIQKEELYSHSGDSAETKNVVDANRAPAGTLKQQLLKWVKKSDVKIQSEEDADEETYEELKALGYVH